MNTVLGYGKIGEYSGPSWELNAISNALARGLITGDADLSAPATREEVIQYVFNTIKPNGRSGKNYMVEYSEIFKAYVPVGSNVIGTGTEINLDAYLGTRVFGLTKIDDEDVFGVLYRTWLQNSKRLVGDYPAETFVDEINTEKNWTGGDLYRAYEWNDDVELYVNGGIYTGAVLNGLIGKIKAGNKDTLFPIGLHVALYDSGGGVNDADDGKVGKIVVTFEHLAQVTKVDSTAGTIDFTIYDRTGDGSRKDVSVTGYITDNTYALKDYILVIPQVDDNSASFDYYRNPDDAPTGAVAAPELILSDKLADQVTVNAQSYTRAPNVGPYTAPATIGSIVVLATVTGDDGTKYYASSMYNYGINLLPTIGTDARLYLDSHGFIIGLDADAAGPAALKYVYVQSIYVDSVISNFTTARVRASVFYGATGTVKTVDLPVNTVKGEVTINGAAISIADLELDGGTGGTGGTFGLLTSGGSKTYTSDDLIGWYYYTSSDDSDTITLRSTAKNDSTTLAKNEAAASIKNGGSVYSVGRIADGTGGPRNYTGGFVYDSSTAPTDIYATSKTVEIYNGKKYTGYTTFPYATGTGSSEGRALAIKNSDGTVDIFYVYGGDAVATDPATYAVIGQYYYEASWSSGRLTYAVKSPTGGVTTAWETSDGPGDGNYVPGQIVNIERQDDGTYKIPDDDRGLRNYGTVATSTTAGYFYTGIVTNVVAYDANTGYIIVSGGGSADIVATTQIFDKKAYDDNTTPRTFPAKNDRVTVYKGANFMGAQYGTVEAIVIHDYNILVDYAADLAATKASLAALDSTKTGVDLANAKEIAKSNAIAVGWVGAFNQFGAYWLSNSTSVGSAGVTSADPGYTTYTSLDWTAALAVASYTPADILGMVSGGWGPSKTLSDIFTKAATVNVTISDVAAIDTDASNASGNEQITFKVTLTSTGISATETLYFKISDLTITI
jgi:hypothetical protein